MTKTTFDWKYPDYLSERWEPVHDDASWPNEYNLSEATIAQLNQIPEARDVELTIARISAIAKFFGDMSSNADFYNNLEETQQALNAFVDAIERAGRWGARAILSPRRKTTPEEYRNQTADEFYRLEQFIHQAGEYSAAINEFFAYSPRKAGRSISYPPHTVAIQLAEAFQGHEHPVSSYIGGPYMETLRLLIEDIFPDLGEEAYQRYGRDAVRGIKKLETK